MRSDMYTAAQGLIARQYELDAISNNIANVSTTGFREVSPFFRTYNHSLLEGPANPLNNAANNQPVVAGFFMHSGVGAIKATSGPLDNAIEGDGFFKVATPDGPRYTRNGHFQIQVVSETESRLATSAGFPVLNRDGEPLTLNKDYETLTIDRSGRVIQDGVEVGQLALVTFADKTSLTPEEDTLMTVGNPNEPELLSDAVLHNGHLETSNVNIAKQMIDMISAQRAYEMNTRTIKTIDSGMNQTIIQGFGPRG